MGLQMAHLTLIMTLAVNHHVACFGWYQMAWISFARSQRIPSTASCKLVNTKKVMNLTWSLNSKSLILPSYRNDAFWPYIWVSLHKFSLILVDLFEDPRNKRMSYQLIPHKFCVFRFRFLSFPLVTWMHFPKTVLQKNFCWVPFICLH